MTRTMEVLLEEVTAKSTKYVKAYNEGGFKKSELKALRNAATAACDKYNLELSKETYRQWNREGDPIKTAIRSRVIPNAIRLKFKTDDDDYMTVTHVPTEYEVNLPMMQVTLGVEAFSNPEWFKATETLAKLIGVTLNKHTGNRATFEYVINKASEEFRFPEGINPASDEGILLAVQYIFDAILFIDDGNGHNLIHLTIEKDEETGKTFAKEWNVVRESMTKSVGVNLVGICNPGTFSGYIMRAMHGILTNGTFGLVAESQDMTLADKPIVTNPDESIRKTEDEALAE